MICSNLVPDHSTIAEFGVRHEDALAELFTGVLGLCRRAALVSVGVVAVDGTKVQAHAARGASLGYEQIAREILAEAAETDRREDELYGKARGDELPEQLRTRAGRRAALRQAREELERERERELGRSEAADCGVAIELDPARFFTRAHGRRAWLREGRRALEELRAREARPVPRRGLSGLRSRRAGSRRSSWSSTRRTRPTRPGANVESPPTARAGWRPARPSPTVRRRPAGTINTTDPDSRLVKTFGQKAIQGYNAQAAVNEHQILVAAEVSVESPDFGHLEPMVRAAERELAAAGVSDKPRVVVAGAGYWHHDQMDHLAGRGITVLIPPDAGKRKAARPGWDGGRYAFMRRVLETERGRRLYGKRQVTIEPVFANTKFNRRLDRFLRRGISACRSEWRLITATHNLLKLNSHQSAATAA